MVSHSGRAVTALCPALAVCSLMCRSEQGLASGCVPAGTAWSAAPAAISSLGFVANAVTAFRLAAVFATSIGLALHDDCDLALSLGCRPLGCHCRSASSSSVPLHTLAGWSAGLFEADAPADPGCLVPAVGSSTCCFDECACRAEQHTVICKLA